MPVKKTIKKRIDESLIKLGAALSPERAKAEEGERRRAEEATTSKQPKSLPQELAEPPTAPQEVPKPEIIRDQETGEITGLTFPDGRTITGSEKDLLPIISKRAPTGTPAGTIEASQAGFQRELSKFSAEEQQKALKLFQEFQGQPLPQELLNQLSPTEISAFQAIAGGVSGQAGTIASGALTGALVGGGPGALVGAGAGIITGIISNIRGQSRDIIKGKARTISTFDSNMNDAITAINGGDNPSANVLVFRDNYFNALSLRQELKIEQQRFIAKGIGKDAQRELIAVETYIEEVLPNLERELQLSILNPNPAKIKRQTPIITEEAENI